MHPLLPGAQITYRRATPLQNYFSQNKIKLNYSVKFVRTNAISNEHELEQNLYWIYYWIEILKKQIKNSWLSCIYVYKYKDIE